MTAKRREFIDRLLRISEINEELLEVGDKNRQPAFTKRIKLVQMGKAEFNLPPPAPAVYAPRHNCKILVVDRTSRYTSEGHTPTNASPKKETHFQKCDQNSFRMLIEKRRSSDACNDPEYQVNFVAPIEYEPSKLKQDAKRRPSSGQKSVSKTANSVKNLCHSKGEGVSGNMLSGKSIRFSRSSTLTVERDRKAEEERREKLEKKKEINRNYARPFNPPPKLTAKSYIVCEVLTEGIRPVVCFNSKNSQEVASLTKIMTCILTIELAERYRVDIDQEEIKIGKYESNIGGTSACIQPGQIYSLRQLLYGLMLPSGNDASLALAVWGGRRLIAAGSDSERNAYEMQMLLKKLTKGVCYNQFLKEMNHKAISLGMTKTKYANSHGLSNSSNRSTAYDIALLSHYAMKHPLFREVVSCQEYQATIKVQKSSCSPKKTNSEENQETDQLVEIKTGREGESKSKREGKGAMEQQIVKWENTHKLLHTRPNEYLGIKTGITPTAGPCLSSMIRVQEREFLIIVLACQKTNLRFKETEVLRKWMLKHLNLAGKGKRPTSKQERATEDYSDSQEEIAQREQ